MDARYPPEALAFGAEVRTWIRDNLPDSTDRDTFMSEWTGKLFDGGFVCASWPKEYGGRGLSVVEQVVLNEEFARAKAPMRVSSLGEILVGPTLLQWGTEEQKHEFLPRILKGEIVWCQGFSEPEAGSDLASLQTSAVRSGDDWIIEGTKIWTSEAEDSDYMILLARTDAEVTPRHAGITFFLMPMRQPGVEVIALPQPDGTRGFNRVEIKGARCPDANVVGGIGNGWKVAMTTLGFERGTSAASSYERLKSELDDMIANAKEQRKNRDPIVRQRLAWAWSKVEILRMSSLRILTAVAHDRHTRETAALEVMNKLYWTDYDKAAQNIAIDLLGPAGQILTGQPDDPRRAAVGLGRREPIYRYPVSPLQSSYFFSLSQSIYGGTSEIQRNIVAERVLGLPR
ncbi:MAG: acyl-CoA dehydrogenase [Actinobacteria bacterium]|jgi:alkylation response protein AidB-like acyl-CoA dehydrogenase|nr:MAG: acyl-CoA dehydrogenase [Actinomycetota bacterium]